MNKNDIYLDLANKNQIRWWNNIGGKLVDICNVNTVVDTNNQPIGYMIWLHKGLFSKFVAKVTNSFWK